MASKPGPLTEWPWERLGSYKYGVLVPLLGHAVHSLYGKEASERDYTILVPFLLLASRLLHGQLWISLARYQTARSKHRISNRGIEFQQVDRERGWDDHAIMYAILLYAATFVIPGASHLPLWNAKGLLIAALIHVGPVEYIYYWAHRALHHHFLFTRYHSHHHSSFVTEPITAVVHPFAEHLLYLAIFAPTVIATWLTGTGSHVTVCGYFTFIDFMNNLGHCNFEFVPKWMFKIFPPLKYLMYTPSFHSLHHSQVHTNFSLFMPIYDYMYNTVDKTTDTLYETSIQGKEEMIDVVHVTHPTSLHSIWHMRLGFAYLAAQPYTYKWYFFLIGPVTAIFAFLTSMLGATFTVEKIKLDKLKMQTWAIPRFNFQYHMKSQKDAINRMIKKAIHEADARGAKVITLGLENQSEDLNGNGGIYEGECKMVKVVDGCSLAAAVVLNNIPESSRQVLMCGNLNKTAYAVAQALCQRGVKVLAAAKHEYEALKLKIPVEHQSYIHQTTSYDCKVWIVSEGLSAREQGMAPKGTLFIPFSQFPPKVTRSDCIYQLIPAMSIPSAVQDVHACENWLPRRVMSAWRIAGMVHALEGWDVHECGEKMLDLNKVWNAALKHGFCPIVVSTSSRPM